jgi:hypothetical protein
VPGGNFRSQALEARMDDAQYGSRNKRGDWKPARLIAYPQVFVWPVQLIGIMKWLFGYPGYLLPWNLLYAGVALACWFYATPPLEAMKQLTAGWIGFLLARNLVLVLLVFGTLHVRLYVQKGQGNAFKYNAKWLDADNSAFLFRNQTIDNMVR